ncbi:MAG: hypothetical protein KAV25_07515 [Methanophagales archaeon]|nr:hypothetical protein [Methanophagales archaeon]
MNPSNEHIMPIRPYSATAKPAVTPAAKATMIAMIAIINSSILSIFSFYLQLYYFSFADKVRVGGFEIRFL